MDSTTHRPVARKTNYLDVLERMKLVTNTTSDTAFAKSIGIRQSSVSAAKERQSIPPTWAIQIAEEYGVSLDWLMFGQEQHYPKGAVCTCPDTAAMQEGEEFTQVVAVKFHGKPQNIAGEGVQLPGRMSRHEQRSMDNTAKETMVCVDCEITMVPIVEARVFTDNGSWETTPDSDRRYVFFSDFLHKKGRSSAMVLVRVTGDSMEPEIKDNDVVLIDTSDTTPRPGRLFAISIEDLVYLKKIDAKPGKLILSCANSAYAPLEVDTREDATSGIRIIGKAVWIGRELD